MTCRRYVALLTLCSLLTVLGGWMAMLAVSSPPFALIGVLVFPAGLAGLIATVTIAHRRSA